MMQFKKVQAPTSFAARGADNHPSGPMPFLDAGDAQLWRRRLLRMQSEISAAGADFDAVMNAVLTGVISLLPKSTGAVLELREGEELVYRGAAGALANLVRYRYPLLGTLAGEVATSGQARLCLDTETDSRVDREGCRYFNIRSMAIVPVMQLGEPVGTLKVLSDIPDAFDPSDILTVEMLTGPITVGLANAAHANATERSARLAQRFAATFEQAAVGIAHVAADGSFLRVNDKFCQIAGHERVGLLAGGFQEITHPDDLNADLDNLNALVAGDIDHYEMEKRYVRSDRSLAWINLTVSLVRQPDGSVDFFVAVIEDISRRKAAELAATHDALTGLPNRRLMLEHLRRSLAQCSRAGQPITVAYLDLDGFKSVNDRLGHGEGDRCLIAVAEALKSALRDGDIVGRLGGDEFALILSDADKNAAATGLARVREAVATTGVENGWGVNVSIGAVVVGSGGGAPPEAVIEQADMLMFQAKRNSSGMLIREQKS